MMMRWRTGMAAAALLAGAANATSRIDAERFKELKAGMSRADVKATLGEPEIEMTGVAPTRVLMYQFLYIQWEKVGLYAEGIGLAGFGPDDHLVTFELPSRKVDPADAQKTSPHGHSDSAEAFARLDAYATDPAWGYGAERPIKVGGLHPKAAPLSEAAYLNALRGPGGEAVDFERLGSCCKFDTSNGIGGTGMLDIFQVSVKGRPGKILLYLDMYDPGPRDIPAGFTYRLKDASPRNAPIARDAVSAASAATTAQPARLDRSHCAPPAWPAKSQELEESGTVRLELQVGTDGTARKTEIRSSSGHPRLDEAALLSFAQCRFIPATQDGTPVAGSVVVDYTWRRP